MNNHKYAKTFFDLCQKANNISKIHAQLKLVAYLFNKVSAFRLVVITKRLNNNDKINIIKKSLYSFDLTVIEFLTIIIKNNRINHLIDIINRFNKLVHAHSHMNNIEITTATKLNDEDLQSLSNIISQKLQLSPKINTSIDTKIIGGIKLRIGNNIFDNSIHYQINQLKKTLHNM